MLTLTRHKIRRREDCDPVSREGIRADGVIATAQNRAAAGGAWLWRVLLP